MAQLTNQFGMTPEKGQITRQADDQNLIECLLATTVTDEVVAATAVKLVDSGGAQIVVEPADAATDDIFGFVVYDYKDTDASNGRVGNTGRDRNVTVARRGTIMFMEASGAIARGAEVQYDPTNVEVATAASSNRRVGRILDKANADGDLVRVDIFDAPGATS